MMVSPDLKDHIELRPEFASQQGNIACHLKYGEAETALRRGQQKIEQTDRWTGEDHTVPGRGECRQEVTGNIHTSLNPDCNATIKFHEMPLYASKRLPFYEFLSEDFYFVKPNNSKW